MSEDGDDVGKLQALQEAAREGLEAIERGEYRRFDRADALIAHLDRLARIAIEGGKLQKP
jgi:hypothetical protein